MAHEAILEATRALLVEGGYGAVSMDKVAANAGVGTQTVYRRWPSKAPMVAEAVMQAYTLTEFTLPDTGDLVEDLRTWMHEMPRSAPHPKTSYWFAPLPLPPPRIYKTGTRCTSNSRAAFHGALTHRLQVGVSSGQVRANADIEAAADALIGATLYRMLSVTTSVDETIRRYDGLIDTLMSGVLIT